MKKYNILIVSPARIGGVEYHRQIMPHNYLRKHYDEFEVVIINEIESDSFDFNGQRIMMNDFLKEFQLVQFSRTFSHTWEIQNTVDKLNKMGIITVLDIDDYWHFDRQHLLYDLHIQDQVSAKIQLSLKLADHITTTTTFFADTISHYNKNVSVLPNAIDPEQDQFKLNETEYDKVRIGWLGSQCHVADIISLSQSLIAMSKDLWLKDKYQLKLGGFNGSEVSVFFERVFTQEYDYLKDHPAYVHYLNNITNTANDTYNNMPYVRMWFKDPNNYARHYNDIDIALAPLTNIKFNNCKSQLKLIEAGFMKKALVCSKIMPYTIDGINNKNCLMVKDKRDMDWYLQLKKLINNPDMITDLGDALHETVHEKYHMATVTKERAALYKHLIENK